MSSDSFAQLSLSDAQLSNLDRMGYRHMTPIQAAALPPALRGDDVIGQAKTGSGKTAVFGIALLGKLNVASSATQALVLCPTRELSLQVASEIRLLARYQQNIKVTALYGGQPISRQKQSLKHGAPIVVGTPGRVKDLLEKKALVLTSVNTVALDEADRMLEMGFIKDIEVILGATPASRQTLLFSATFPENIQALSRRFQRNPTHIQVDTRRPPAAIRQHVYTCAKETKLDALKTLLRHYQPESVVVFCNFKQTTREVCDFLDREGFSALALNGDLEQQEREEILIRFKHQSCSVLVATDVAARGLDIKDMPAVINFELPPDPEIYVHRIGRTGRAGNTGLALSLCTSHDQTKLSLINEFQRTAMKGESIALLRPASPEIPAPPNSTLAIAGGRKDKIRAGEILGALTGEGGIEGKQVGKIDVMDYASYVAITRESAQRAYQRLKTGKIKGRKLRIRLL
jgi:ATP-independent RNA helicase DbpA